MKRRFLSSLACALVLVFFVLDPPARAQDGEALDPMEEGIELRERLDRLIERVKLAQSRVDTMTAEFIQEQASKLLVETETRAGTFYYRSKPETIRWEYETPKPIVMLMDDEVLTTFYPDLNRASRTGIKRYSERVFKYLGASGSLETMTRYFWLTARFPSEEGAPYKLDLRPRYNRVEKRIKGMELWVDPETFLPVYMKYVEPNGDYSEYRFVDIAINRELDEEIFELDLPEDVELDS